jgi:hypothetical protein
MNTLQEVPLRSCRNANAMFRQMVLWGIRSSRHRGELAFKILVAHTGPFLVGDVSRDSHPVHFGGIAIFHKIRFSTKITDLF